jgi:hypothetical protein
MRIKVPAQVLLAIIEGIKQCISRGNDAVEEGTRLITCLDAGQMRLGEIADRLETKYGDSTLVRFAEAIGTNVNTLQNYRSVYRTWHEDPRVISFPKFSVAKALVKHPERARIVADHPEITERGEQAS